MATDDTFVLARTLGACVRETRRAQGLTQEELAEGADVSERLVRQIEKGTATGISLDRLVRVLSFLGLGLQLKSGPIPVARSQGEEYTATLQSVLLRWDDYE
ncbi:helix-turn-helix domain-containing protein [Olsenella sp. YH-ols2217]|uniref:Helix-turn-helix domain-containing protein n=1 Tax=Kribbibacterium absianum TaxID=3044210 RepID=A0ABT6ZLB4_9ACTN|nr:MULTISPECIES: helix-turn-helix domain-containing protein [unclassified Olsenella]MDJ1122403.1 helix-turn-helix domain-containing protein [Olsenella sp. YH-ols2216]MDJ1129343.1 helix-turn-helix domain-containing protein [Olsenella sp. YH-ols2217]